MNSLASEGKESTSCSNWERRANWSCSGRRGSKIRKGVKQIGQTARQNPVSLGVRRGGRRRGRTGAATLAMQLGKRRQDDAPASSLSSCNPIPGIASNAPAVAGPNGWNFRFDPNR